MHSKPGQRRIGNPPAEWVLGGALFLLAGAISLGLGVPLSIAVLIVGAGVVFVYVVLPRIWRR